MPRVIAVLLIAVSISACQAGSRNAAIDGTDLSSEGPTPTASPASPTPVETAGLVGAWTTPSISVAEVMNTLAGAGLKKAAESVIGDIHFPNTFVIEIDPVAYHVSAAEGVIDHGAVSVNERTLTLTPDCAGCSVVYTYALSGDELRLDFVSDTSPDYQGVPDEAFQRAIYTTATFRRS